MLERVTSTTELHHLRKLCMINSWTYAPSIHSHTQARRSRRVFGDVLVATSPKPKDSCEYLSQWIVQDDPIHKRRIIAIQGTNTLDHWKQNLRFHPQAFIDDCLQTYVHRGCYESALMLYDTLKGYVEESARLGFTHLDLTGHSIGGSIAILLKLMIHYWKIRQPLTVTAYAFGSPGVFSEGFQDEVLLDRMNIPVDTIQNITMHKDIVPKAFTCDYSILRNVLTVFPSFSHHPNLHRLRQPHVYSFVGRMLILQPPPPTSVKQRKQLMRLDGSLWHPMLPSEAPGLYRVMSDDAPTKRLAFVEKFLNEPHPIQMMIHPSDIMRYHSIDSYARAFKELRLIEHCASLWSD